MKRRGAGRGAGLNISIKLKVSIGRQRIFPASPYGEETPEKCDEGLGKSITRKDNGQSKMPARCKLLKSKARRNGAKIQTLERYVGNINSVVSY